MERRAVLPQSRLLLLEGSRAAVPGRDVVWLLSSGPQSEPAAGRSGESALGEPELERGRAVLLGRSHLQLAGRREPEELFLSAVTHLASRLARYLARLDRQHQ